MHYKGAEDISFAARFSPGGGGFFCRQPAGFAGPGTLFWSAFLVGVIVVPTEVLASLIFILHGWKGKKRREENKLSLFTFGSLVQAVSSVGRLVRPGDVTGAVK